MGAMGVLQGEEDIVTMPIVPTINTVTAATIPELEEITVCEKTHQLDPLDILALADVAISVAPVVETTEKEAELLRFHFDEPKLFNQIDEKLLRHMEEAEVAEAVEVIQLINDIEKQQRRQTKRMNTLKLLLIGCVLTCITNFPSAFLHTSANTAVNELSDYLRNSYSQRGSLPSESIVLLLRSAMHSSWYAGQVVGALFAPYLTDKYGRKPAYLLATGMMTFACAVQMLATLFPYPELLIAGRTLASAFSPMSDTVAILYLQEMSPPKLRGALGSLFATGYSALALLGMIAGMKSVAGHSLTLLYSIPVIPGILSLFFLVWLPETPKFLLITKNSRKAALKSLNFFQGGIPSNKDEILDSYAREAKDEPIENASILSLFRVSHLRRALILSLFSMVLTLAFFPILQNSTFFFQKLNVSSDFAQILSTALNVVLLCCCIVAAFLLDKLPRRTLLLFFGAGSTISLIGFAAFASFVHTYDWLKYGAVCGIFGYIICYGFAVGPISYFLAPELVPQQNRSSMFCLCFSITSVLIVITSFFTVPLYEKIGAVVIVLLFVIPSGFGLLYLYFYLPETRDKETHEIVAVLRADEHILKQKRDFVERKILHSNVLIC